MPLRLYPGHRPARARRCQSPPRSNQPDAGCAYYARPAGLGSRSPQAPRGHVTFFDDAQRTALETLSFDQGHCIHYHEHFHAGDASHGAYVCQLTIVATKLTLTPSAKPGAFVAPAPREALAGTRAIADVTASQSVLTIASGVSGVKPSLNDGIPTHLAAPQPQPSPTHTQIHLTQEEWKELTKGRWDRHNNKGFLKAHQLTEFHISGDPCTYRVDAKGKMEMIYDSEKVYNITGTRKGFPHIPLTLNGEPTFAGTKHMYPPGPPHKTVVTIEMTGNRDSDFLRANTEAGLLDILAAQGLKNHKPPKGYTWHHRDDFEPNPSPPPVGTCTMELVSNVAHRRTFVHFGSCDQYNKHLGKKIYK